MVMSLIDPEYIKKAYPEWFSPTNPLDIITGIFIFSLVFLIPYLYIRFMENRLIAFGRGRLIPFIRFRLRLEKLINLIDRILKIQIFRNPRAKV